MPQEIQKPAFPKPTTDGFCFLDEDDELIGIESQTYENGNEVKRVMLKDGRHAVIRELKAWEMEETERFHKQNQELMFIAVATKAMKIDGKNVAFEDVKNMRAKDWTLVKGAVAKTNFS